MSVEDGYSRAQRIEKEARGLVAWCDEFVGRVYDNSGNSLTKSGEWQEVLGDLRSALQPLAEQPLREPPCDLCVPDESGTCTLCGWTK